MMDETKVTALNLETMEVGLLGVQLTRDEVMAGGSALANARRLDEIERRIIGIESELGMLNPGGQFGGAPFPNPF